jgi:uncharacterized protein (TIGR03435 family)
MMRTFFLATLLALSLECQDLGKAPAFEVASITPCKPGTPEPMAEHMGMLQFTAPGGRFRASAIDLKYLMEWAYSIQPSQHSGGPSWWGTDRYDIVAKAEGNATDEQQKLMLRTLLAERFGLKFHYEKKKLPVYVISVGKAAPKLFPPKDEEVHSIRIMPQQDADQKTTTFHVVATRYSLTQLTDVFARQLERIFVNETGLNGDYDFTLDLTPDESRPSPLDPSLLIAAMRDQLGLQMKSQEAVVDFLVIDSVEKVAAGN